MKEIDLPKKLHQDMLILLGKIDAICYPLSWENGETDSDQAYYDLLYSIKE